MLSSSEVVGSTNGLSSACDRRSGLACAQGSIAGLQVAFKHLQAGLEGPNDRTVRTVDRVSLVKCNIG